jgi:CRP/FNR family cyclic AMP-dependent transcriptional regulator
MSALQSKIWYLEQINLLKDFQEEELKMFADLTTMRASGKNEYIYFPNDPSKIVFFLKRGRVKIGKYTDDGKEIIKAILHPGEIFGEMSIAGQESRTDFAQALDDDVMICATNAEDIKKIMNKNAKLSMAITRSIGERLMNVERKMESLIFKDARTRIIDLLKQMADKRGIKIGDEILLKHDLTHQDIANLTATSRQTVTVTLNELKDQDLIYMERKKILLRDIDKLK